MTTNLQPLVLDGLRSEDAPPDWPVMGPEAFSGLAGEIVTALDPYTEADPIAVLLSLLTAYGSAVGPGPAAIGDSARHSARIFAVVVGASAKARKGTSLRVAESVLRDADPRWFQTRRAFGLSSGEGLVTAVADPEPGENGAVPPPADKRLFVIEEEFARVLSVGRREGSTLSAIIRTAWDSGDLAVLTKTPLRATGAHISILGHITLEELKAKLTETDMVNGLGNRFLYALARRSKRLPSSDPPPAELLADFATRLRTALAEGRRHTQVRRSPDAENLWRQLYHEMADDDPGGLLGAVVARPEPQTLRLAVTYALLDGSNVIALDHLRAAWAVWSYCRASAELIFGDALGDQQADALLEEIRRAGRSGLDGSGQSAVFGRHLPARRLAAVRQRLEVAGKILTVCEESGGRPRIVSYDMRHAPPSA